MGLKIFLGVFDIYYLVSDNCHRTKKIYPQS